MRIDRGVAAPRLIAGAAGAWMLGVVAVVVAALAGYSLYCP